MFTLFKKSQKENRNHQEIEKDFLNSRDIFEKKRIIDELFALMKKKNPPHRALKYSKLFKKLVKFALQELVILQKEDSLNENQLMLLEEVIRIATLYAKISEEEIREVLRSKSDIFSSETIWNIFLKSDSDQKIIIIRQLISREIKTSDELTIPKLIEVAFEAGDLTEKQIKRLDKLTSFLPNADPSFLKINDNLEPYNEKKDTFYLLVPEDVPFEKKGESFSNLSLMMENPYIFMDNFVNLSLEEKMNYIEISLLLLNENDSSNKIKMEVFFALIWISESSSKKLTAENKRWFAQKKWHVYQQLLKPNDATQIKKEAENSQFINLRGGLIEMGFHPIFFIHLTTLIIAASKNNVTHLIFWLREKNTVIEALQAFFYKNFQYPIVNMEKYLKKPAPMKMIEKELICGCLSSGDQLQVITATKMAKMIRDIETVNSAIAKSQGTPKENDSIIQMLKKLLTIHDDKNLNILFEKTLRKSRPLLEKAKEWYNCFNQLSKPQWLSTPFARIMQLPVSTIDDSGRQSRILVPSRIGIILHESFKQLVSAIKIAIIDVLPHMKSIREVQDLKDIRYLQADTRELYTLYANQDVLSFYYQKYSTKDEMCQALKDDYDKLLNQILYVSRIVNKTISENAVTEVDQDQLTQKHNEIRDGMLFVASCAWEWLQANINEHFNQIPAFSINPSYKMN